VVQLLIVQPTNVSVQTVLTSKTDIVNLLVAQVDKPGMETLVFVTKGLTGMEAFAYFA
jgi:hypothetical protein